MHIVPSVLAHSSVTKDKSKLYDLKLKVDLVIRCEPSRLVDLHTNALPAEPILTPGHKNAVKVTGRTDSVLDLHET